MPGNKYRWGEKQSNPKAAVGLKRCCKLSKDIGIPVLFTVLFLEMEESSWTCFLVQCLIGHDTVGETWQNFQSPERLESDKEWLKKHIIPAMDTFMN